MRPQAEENVYVPRVAAIERVEDEIPDLRSFYWHFADPVHDADFARFRPGQFAQVSVVGAGEFPLSLPPSPTEQERFFTVRRVGNCTAALHGLKPGDLLGIRGPYGNGFAMDEYAGKDLVFVAGGIGVIPLRSCIVYAMHRREQYGRIQIFYGARTPSELMYRTEMQRWAEEDDLELYVTVDRGDESWTGPVGVVGSLFRLSGVEVAVENSIAFVCGPPVMFRFVIKDLLGMGFSEDCIVPTMERYMKCGVGKCGHCCIGVAYVCVDGPVFTYAQLRKLGEEI